MPGPYDYVGMQGPPTAAQWQGPSIDFSALANIPAAMEQGRQNAIKRAVQTSLPQGLTEFQRPDGSYDYTGLVNRMIQAAGPEGAKIADELMQTALGTQLQPAKEAAIRQDFPGSTLGTQQSENGGQSTGPGPGYGLGTSGQPNPALGTRRVGAEQGTPAAGPANVTGDTGQDQPETLRSLYTGLGRGQDVSGLIARFAGRYGGADVPLTKPQIADATTIFGRNRPSENATRGSPGGFATGNAGATGQPPPISNQNAETQPAPTSAAEVNRNPPPQQGQVTIPQAGQQAIQAPAYQQALQRAEMLREAAKRADLLGMKDRAATLNKQADDQLKIAEQEPQHQVQIETGKSLAGDLVKTSSVRLANFQAAADTYDQQEKPLLQMAQSVLSNPDMYTGAAGKLSLDFNKVRAVYGDQNAGLMQQMLTKITAQSVLGDISQQAFDKGDAGASGGRIFKQTVDLVTQAAPTLEGTVAGNRALVAIKMRLGQVKSDIAKMAVEYTSDPAHPILDANFNKMLQDYGAKLQLWTKQELANPTLIAAPHAPATLRSKDDYMKWGQSMGLSEGDAFYGPQGQQLEMPHLVVHPRQ